MTLVPLTVTAASKFVDEQHRRLSRPRGAMFAVGLEDGAGKLVAVAMAGKGPRLGRTRFDFDITRLASDGTANACSRLYSALCAAAKRIGYRRAWTATHLDEAGASVKAAGFKEHHVSRAGTWDRPSRPRARVPGREGPKRWWVRDL